MHIGNGREREYRRLSPLDFWGKNQNLKGRKWRNIN
jgi:hypothetical protein